MAKMTMLDAAREILKDHPRGLTLSEVFRLAMERGLVKPGGKTPQNSMRSNLYQHMKNHAADPEFVSLGEGRWALARKKK